MMFTYQTVRLSVLEATTSTPSNSLLMATIELLSPKVVANLPPYFNNVNSMTDAKNWFEKMVSESRLFVVKELESGAIIGFVFMFTQSSTDAHIGYLIGESHWNKGYATELLKGMMHFIQNEHKLHRLIAGVDVNNYASIKLLKKLGFTKSSENENETVFYGYNFMK